MTCLEDRTRTVFPHARAAVRAWITHRRGPTMAGPARGPGGHRAGIDDALAVAAVLTDLGLVLDPPCPRMKQVLAWSLGLTPRGELETLAKRVERHMRRAGVVAPPTRLPRTWSDEWQDSHGEAHRTTAIIEDRTVALDAVSETCLDLCILDCCAKSP